LHAKVIKLSPTVGLTGVHNRRFVVTRFGDEEFAIILPETDADGARIVAENVRKRVEINLTRLQPTTVSLGITSLREGLLSSQVLWWIRGRRRSVRASARAETARSILKIGCGNLHIPT
jgi:GGDEF domain-containing protein